jgi:hypothetical protein
LTLFPHRMATVHDVCTFAGLNRKLGIRSAIDWIAVVIGTPDSD